MLKYTLLCLLLLIVSCKEVEVVQNSEYKKLTKEEIRVIINRGTEAPYTGEYNDFFEKGTYHCKQCNAPLYRSDSKFKSSCGWPSFDDEIEGAVERRPDPDGRRVEIICSNCGGHLGHVFLGEGYTDKNIRHCVNSISLVFVPDSEIKDYKKAYFAGGCFWGIEYYMQKREGVIEAVSGYMGGETQNPTYHEVCSGQTGHYEAVEVTYDPGKISYEELARLFFEIHDPTQKNGQGVDIGEQYLSVIFYNDEKEKETAQKLIDILKEKGYDIATSLMKADRFWKAEDYHQDYYINKNRAPSCHFYQKRF